MKAVLSVVFSVFLLSGPMLFSDVRQTVSGSTEDEARVLSLETAWNLAESTKDFRALSLLLADSLSYVDDDGTLMNKTEFLDKAKGRFVQAQIVNESVAAKIYGQTAVVVGVYRETGTNRGKSYRHRGRFTDTWIKVGSGWQCVASESTMMAD
jgi:hypothetical protein